MMTIEEFGRRLRAREVTSAQVTDECLRRIDADNPRLNAFILVMADEARRQAREADRELAAGRDRGPLHGVPISIKDLFDIRGTPTTAASRVRDGPRRRGATRRPSPHLRQAGAVFVGKTNLHEFAFGTTNEDSAFGPARNPHDPTRSPGGSSGGSAASVAAGMALATLGTDTGGSIRIPAAACGIVGLKPTYGEVSTDGVVPLSRTLRSRRTARADGVTDACLVYHALLGDAGAMPPAPMPVERLRLAVPRALLLRSAGRRGAGAVRGGARSLRAAGAHVDDVDDPSCAATSRRSTCTSCWRRGRVSRGDARDDARAVHAAGAAAAGNGTLRARRGLRAGARRTRRAAPRGRRGARRSTTRSCCRRCRFRRRRIGATTVQVGNGDRAGAQPHAPADAALQPHRPSGDLDSRRPRRRPGCRAASSSSGAAGRPMRCCAWRSPASVTR